MKPGIGAMLFMLGGGSKHSSDEYVGKKIKSAVMYENALYIDFEDGVQIRIFDDGQSCCEHRYMTCDDNLIDLVGNNWVAAEVTDGPSLKDGGEWSEDHDQQFLVIKTSGGVVTIANHNEHNGYYGGFGLTIEDRKDV